MKLVLSVIAAVVAAAALSGTASAAPRMWIDQVASPTTWSGNGYGTTTWHVGLSGISAWTSTDCSSSATYAQSHERLDGLDLNWGGAKGNNWSFHAQPVPFVHVTEFDYNFDTLSGITATCKLTRDVYLGKRAYRQSIDAHRDATATVSRRGCPIYSYSQGGLTIDCRHSRSSGSATWMFGRRRSDRGGYYGIRFDRSKSTMGPHSISGRLTPTRAFVTETVSPGTMITVTSVYLEGVRRLFWRKVYRHDRKMLKASWPS
jgi:hypothetical protein